MLLRDLQPVVLPVAVVMPIAAPAPVVPAVAAIPAPVVPPVIRSLVPSRRGRPWDGTGPVHPFYSLFLFSLIAPGHWLDKLAKNPLFCFLWGEKTKKMAR